MEIINNRYKIVECLKIDSFTSKYEATDLMQNNNPVLLYIIKESSYLRAFINHCVRNFYQFSSLSHPNIVKLISFGIIDSIDDKPVNETLFFYTTELINPTLNHNLKNFITKQTLLSIYSQLARLIDYLHFHGIFYGFINFDNLLIYHEAGQFKIKLRDLMTIKLRETNSKYSQGEGARFEAPELGYGIEVGVYIDIYSLGVLLYELYTQEPFQPHRLGEKINLQQGSITSWDKQFYEIIKNATQYDFIERFQSIHAMNREIVKLYKLGHKIEDKQDVENLNFKTPLVGRDVELKKILSLKESPEKKNLVLLWGDRGIGKTRLMNEIKYQMRWSRLHIIHHNIIPDKNSFYQIIPFMLKNVLKLAHPNTINKYAEELVKLIPEIGINKNIRPSRELREDREILRFYDRVTNFIIEVLGNRPSIIMIDDFHSASKTFVEFVDYFIKLNKLKKAPIILMFSLINEGYCWEKTKDRINEWRQGELLEIKLSRLSVEETAQMIRNILGWNKDPLRFATRIMKETEGVPVLIEEAIKELYAQRILYVDYSTKEDGFAWQSHTEDYTKIKLPENLDDAVISLINTLDEKTVRVLKIVSLFSTTVSREIIAYILGKDMDYSQYLGRLTQLKIINEKLEDWGYTYGFYRSQLKSYIYNSIDAAEKIRLHKRVSEVLEEQYKREGRENKEELIYHLFQSNQRDKAVYYCIEAGDSMYNLRIYSQAMIFYKKAYEILEDSIEPRKFQLLLKMGEVCQNQGNNYEALSCYDEVVSNCKAKPLLHYAIEAKCKIAQILMNRNELEKGKLVLAQTLEMAEEIQYHEGMMKAGYLLCRIYMHQKETEQMEALCKTYLTLAQGLNDYGYMGMFLSQKGVTAFFRGEILKAKEYFELSVVYLEKGQRLEETSRPINNIGVLLQDHFLNVPEAREYFERSAKIAQQYHRMDDLFRAQNNIADSYMHECRFDKAIEVLHNNISLAIEYEDEAMKLLGYSNLIICFTRISDYKQAYHYVLKAQVEFSDYSMNTYFADSLFESMIYFYMAMGDYEKVLSLIDQHNEVKGSHERLDLILKSMRFFSNYALKRTDTVKELLEVVYAYRDTPYIKERRILLLMAVDLLYRLDDRQLAKLLLKEDEALVESYDNYDYQMKRKYFECLLYHQGESLQIWENLLVEISETYEKEIKWQIYERLGALYFKERDYYRATSYYLNALEVIQGLLARTPREYKESYLKVKNKFRIKEQLLKMERVIQNQTDPTDVKEPVQEDVLDFVSFFDVSRYKELFHNPAFYDLALQQYKALISIDIDSIESLVAALTNDVVYNLGLITRLAGKYVLATRGALLGVKDEGYEFVTSFGSKISLEEIRHILEKCAVTKEGLLIENHLTHGIENSGLYNSKDTRAIICLPIINNSRNDEIPGFEQRQPVKEKVKVIGYLYQETDKVFNNFSQETFNDCKKLLPLACIMLNNYYLQISSSIDKMTGAYVRKTIEKILLENIEAAKEAEQQFSIIMCDIDHFKCVNDTYGHQRGDMVLTEVGRVIREHIRSSDHVGRYGGEEFIIILPGARKQDAFIIAEKIRNAFQEAKLLGDEVELTISCGVAGCPEDGITKEILIEKADQALYHAKEQGRNRTVFYENDIGFVDKRTDKLAGIVSGNVVQDQRNVLVIAEAIELLTEGRSLEDKIYIMLGRLIEILEAEEGIVFTVKNNQIKSQLCRRRFMDNWQGELNYNSRLIGKVIQSRQGEYLIDWEDISHIDIFTGTPNWKSVIVTPIIYNGVVKGVIYLSVSVKEKEFDFNAYNLVKLTSSILGPILGDF